VSEARNTKRGKKPRVFPWGSFWDLGNGTASSKTRKPRRKGNLTRTGSCYEGKYLEKGGGYLPYPRTSKVNYEEDVMTLGSF